MIVRASVCLSVCVSVCVRVPTWLYACVYLCKGTGFPSIRIATGATGIRTSPRTGKSVFY